MEPKVRRIRRAQRLKGAPVIPGDKSISHRGLIFGALAHGATEVIDILDSGDVQSTARCLRAMGVEISTQGNVTHVRGTGALKNPAETLDCGNSGTTMRLLMGVLAGRGVSATLTGDGSLVRRPMKRVAEPLRKMGAELTLTGDNFAPLTVRSEARLKGVEYRLPVASAQIKTAILLAGIYADGVTTLTGEIHSRDHTERLLAHFGVAVDSTPTQVSIRGGQSLSAARVQVPGDPSTAAFWMGAASLIEGAEIRMENIALNPTRIGFLRALQKMGAEISIEVVSEKPEPVGRIRVAPARLSGVTISAEEVPTLIDELPLLAVLATQAHGVTEVSGAEELRVKESDRLEAVAKNLRAMGATIELRHDGFRIEGPQKLRAATIETFDDHRIAMAFSIAGLLVDGETVIENADCVGISYPAFYQTLEQLTAP